MDTKAKKCKAAAMVISPADLLAIPAFKPLLNPTCPEKFRVERAWKRGLLDRHSSSSSVKIVVAEVFRASAAPYIGLLQYAAVPIREQPTFPSSYKGQQLSGVKASCKDLCRVQRLFRYSILTGAALVAVPLHENCRRELRAQANVTG